MTEPLPDTLRTAMRGFDRAALGFVLLMLTASAAAYRALPPVLATHWGADNAANGWTPRPLAVLLMPGMGGILWLVFRAAPSVDPRRASYERFAETHRTIGIATLALLAAVHGVILGVGLGYRVPVAQVSILGVGALLFVLGNVLPRVRPNYFVGIRTPWTLASDAVWTRTHRVGGYLFVAAGVVAIVAGIAGGLYAAPVAIGAALAAACTAVLYSYVAWRRESAGTSTPTPTRP